METIFINIFPTFTCVFSHNFEPVLEAIAILSSSGLSCVPKLGTGIADIQAPDSGWAEANRRALENWSALRSKVFFR